MRTTRLTMAPLWVLLTAVLAAPIVYVIVGTPGGDFIDNVMSGLFATAAALIGGIPVALWIDRAVKHREEVTRHNEERKREIELLDLIREELSFTDNLFRSRKGSTLTLPLQPLKSDLWAASAAAGTLNLISNHRLLNRITSAYYIINVVRNIEEQAYISDRKLTVRLRGMDSATMLLIEDARKFDQLLSDSIKEALREIDEEVAKKQGAEQI